MYKVQTFCLIDRSIMATVDRDSKNFYHCNVCGFEYWWLCTDEQARSEAEKYLKTLSDEKIKNIARSVKSRISNLPTDKDLKRRADDFYEQLRVETKIALGDLEQNLTNLNLGVDGILKGIKTGIITYTKLDNGTKIT